MPLHRRLERFTRPLRAFPFVTFVLAELVVLPASALAQPTPDAASQAADRAQRDQQDREREELRRARESARPPTVIETPEVTGRRPKVAAGPKREIRELVITGADHLRPRFRAQLAARYTGALGLDDVQELLSDITRHYVLRGYATTRAYLPEQDLSSGVLQVIVVEGRVERIAGVGRNIFPSQPGDLLDLRAMEQGIDNLNRLPSNNATLDLRPGTKPGDTVVAVGNPRGRPWRVSTSFDNTGTVDTGRDQLSATVAADDLLGLADSLTVNHRRAVPYHAGEQASQSTTGSYSVPWGWQFFTVGGTASSYALTYHAPSGFALPFTGNSRSLFGRLDRLLYRNQSARLNASATLTWRSAENFLLGSLIDVSSRDTTALDVGLDFSTALGRGVVSASVGVGVGLPIFGSAEDPAGLPDFAPHAGYVKEVFSLGYSLEFKAQGLTFAFATALNGQVSRDVLYGSDQLTVGGLYAVRGFDRTNLAGDVGYVWRNDLSLPLSLAAPFGGRFGSRLGFRPYLGLDVGRAWSRVSLAGFIPQEGLLAGSAVGASLTLGRASVDLSFQAPLVRPSGMNRESGRVYVRAGFNF